jgi:hypothetical protein
MEPDEYEKYEKQQQNQTIKLRYLINLKNSDGNEEEDIDFDNII